MGMELRSGSVVGQGILNPQLRPVFEEGCKVLFERWTALNLAVENEWGGQDSRQKAQALFAETLQWFFRKKGKARSLLQPVGQSSLMSYIAQVVFGAKKAASD